MELQLEIFVAEISSTFGHTLYYIAKSNKFHLLDLI